MFGPMAASLTAPMTSSLIQLVSSSMINAISGKGVRRGEKRQEVGFLPILAAPLLLKGIFGKEVMDKNFYSFSIL